MPHRRWTDERADVLRGMLAAGNSPRRIGDALGISRQAVNRRIVLMKLPRVDLRGAPRARYSEETIDSLISAYLDPAGGSLSEILEAHGVRNSSVLYNALRRRGISTQRIEMMNERPRPQRNRAHGGSLPPAHIRELEARYCAPARKVGGLEPFIRPPTRDRLMAGR
jgi:transposase-like protein